MPCPRRTCVSASCLAEGGGRAAQPGRACSLSEPVAPWASQPRGHSSGELTCSRPHSVDGAAVGAP